MKKILLIGLSLCSAPLLDAMANPATMLKASAMLRRNLQMVDVDVTVEHRADGTTFIHYIRNGQEMAVFNADLLKNSGMIRDMLGDLGSSDEILSGAAKQLFDGLSIEQIKLAIQALDLNNQSDATKQFIDQLGVDNLGWLANWTNKWALENVYNVLIPKIASDKSIAFDLYNRGLINNDVAQDVSDKLDMQDVRDILLKKRLFRDITPHLKLQPHEMIVSAVFNSDGSNILVATSNKIMIYDLHDNLTRLIASNDYESAIYSPDELQILGANRNGMKIYDLRGNLIILINFQLHQGEWVWGDFRYGPDRLHIIVTTNEKVMIYDLQGNLIRSIMPLLNGNEYVTGSSNSSDGKFILIKTDERVMIYDFQGNLIRLITPQLQEQEGFKQRERIGLATFSPDGKSILIPTTEKVLIYDLQGNLIRLITPQLQQQQYEFISKAVYNPDGTKIFIRTSKKREMDYDLEGKLLKIIPWDEEAQYSPDGSRILYEDAWGLFIYPNVNLTNFNLAQKQFLLKASEAWKANKPYILSDYEIEVYNSLPEVFKYKKLFELPSSGEVEL